MLVDGNRVGTASAIVGDKGSMSFFSLMEMTIFSRPNEVMCFSLPLPQLPDTSIRCVGGRLISSGADCWVDDRCSRPSSSTEEMESTLADRSGMSLELGLGRFISIAGVVASSGCDSQQKVSRFHILQLRFSNRRPSSIDSAHLEKTVEVASRSVCHREHGMSRSAEGAATHQSTCQRGSPHSSCQSYASCPHRPLARGLLFWKASWISGWCRMWCTTVR